MSLASFKDNLISRFDIVDDYIEIKAYSNDNYQLNMLTIVGFDPIGGYFMSTHHSYTLGKPTLHSYIPIFDSMDVGFRTPEVLHFNDLCGARLSYKNMFNMLCPVRVISYINPKYSNLATIVPQSATIARLGLSLQAP